MAPMSCKSCCWMKKHDSMKGAGYCLFNPPVVTFVPTMTKQLVNKELIDVPGMSPASANPLVREDHFCHNWSAIPVSN